MYSPRVLFILKRRLDYDYDYDYDCNNNQSTHYCDPSLISVSTGLYNSAQFVNDMLVKNGIESKLVVVIDNNDIDREVTAYKPTHVIIEALWVVPEKFQVLAKLHPLVEWVIRFHSEIPFIANEGMAMKWLYGYIKAPNVIVGVNSKRMLEEIKFILKAAGYPLSKIRERVKFLPNFYPVDDSINCQKYDSTKLHIDVGCFGAIRPMKNQLMQAVAALEFADSLGKKLYFHLNAGRVETKGDPVLHNLEALFRPLEEFGHKLIVHRWTSHEAFLDTVKSMDIGMQVSLSETFNIVGADLVTSGIPIVVSKEIPWAKLGLADPTKSDDIIAALKNAWRFRCFNVFLNVWGLTKYCEQSEEEWLEFFGKS